MATANAHAWTMVTVTVLVIAGICVRVFAYWDEQLTRVRLSSRRRGT